MLCGGIANYNATEPWPGPKNYFNLVVQRGRMEGFIVTDYMPRAPRGCARNNYLKGDCRAAWHAGSWTYTATVAVTCRF